MLAALCLDQRACVIFQGRPLGLAVVVSETDAGHNAFLSLPKQWIPPPERPRIGCRVHKLRQRSPVDGQTTMTCDRRVLFTSGTRRTRHPDE